MTGAPEINTGTGIAFPDSFSRPSNVARKSLMHRNSTRRADTVMKYVHDTRLLKVVDELLKRLIRRPELPYNPYPGLIQRLEHIRERFSLARAHFTSNELFLPKPLIYIMGGYLASEKSYDIWGLADMSKLTSGEHLKSLNIIISELVLPKPSYPKASGGYIITPVISLRGDSIFAGQFVRDITELKFHEDVIISGEFHSESMKLFSEYIFRDIVHLANSKALIVLGVRIGKEQKTTVGNSNTVSNYPFWSYPSLWTTEMIQKDQYDFIRASIDVTNRSELITVTMAFRVLASANTPSAIIRKRYNLVFIADTGWPESDENKGITMYSQTEDALFSLYQGVFFSPSHASFYLQTFVPKYGVVFDNPVRIAEELSQMTPHDDDGDADDDETATGGGDIHGFIDKEYVRSGPFSEKFLKTFKQMIYRQILQMQPFEAYLFEITHLILLLVGIRNVDLTVKLRSEIRMIYNSEAADLEYIIRLSEILTELITDYEASKAKLCFRYFYVKFLRRLRRVFQPEDQRIDLPSYMKTAGNVIFLALKRLHSNYDEFDLEFDLTAADTLRFIRNYCRTLFVRAAENVAAQCLNFQDLLVGMQTQDGRVIFEYQNFYRDEVIDCPYRFGAENAKMLARDFTSISVDHTVGRAGLERGLAQYLTDTRIDEVWRGTLIKLLDREPLPINPYCSVVSDFRRACLKMDLLKNYDETIMPLMLPTAGSIQSVDPANFVCKYSEANAYGYRSSVQLLDETGEAYEALYEIIDKVTNVTFDRKAKGFKVARCTALTDSSVYFGRMAPYITTLEVTEHYFFKGQEGSFEEAPKVFAELILSHILELDEIISDVIFFGVTTADGASFWRITELRQRHGDFMWDIVRSCEQQENIVLKVFVVYDWHYVMVNKLVRMYWIEENDANFREYSTINFAEMYMSVYPTAQQAGFYHKTATIPLPVEVRDPYGLARRSPAIEQLNANLDQAMREHSWLQATRLILIRALIVEDYSVLPDCWRMFNSVGGQLEYVMSLVATLTALAIHLLDSRKEYEKKNLRRGRYATNAKFVQPRRVRIDTGGVEYPADDDDESASFESRLWDEKDDTFVGMTRQERYYEVGAEHPLQLEDPLPEGYTREEYEEALGRGEVVRPRRRRAISKYGSEAPWDPLERDSPIPKGRTRDEYEAQKEGLTLHEYREKYGLDTKTAIKDPEITEAYDPEAVGTPVPEGMTREEYEERKRKNPRPRTATSDRRPSPALRPYGIGNEEQAKLRKRRDEALYATAPETPISDKGGPRQESPDFLEIRDAAELNTVDAEVLSDMIDGLRLKLFMVASRHCALLPECMARYLLSALDSVVVEKNDSWSIRINEMTPLVLDRIHDMLQCAVDTLCADLVSSLPVLSDVIQFRRYDAGIATVPNKAYHHEFDGPGLSSRELKQRPKPRKSMKKN